MGFNLKTGQSTGSGNRNFFSFIELFVLLLLFCGTMNMIGRYYYFTYAAFFVFVCCKQGVLPLNASMLMLVLFSGLIVVFSGDEIGSVTELLKPFLFPISFCMGYNLVKSKTTGEGMERCTKVLIFLLSAGFLTHFLLNFVTNIGSHVRNTVDFWTGSVLSATGQATLACPAIGCICALLVSKEKLWVKLLVGAVLMAILAYSLVLASRTAFLLVIIMIMVSFLYFFFFRANKGSKVRLVCGVLAVVVILVCCYELDLFGMRSLVENSNLYRRFLADNSAEKVNQDGRFAMKLQFLERLEKYPFGGNHILREVGNYAHDLYLDTYDSYGILTALAITVYILMTVWRLIKLLWHQRICMETKQLVLCLYMVMYIEFMLEPILAGMPWLLATFCVIDGAVVKLLSTRK